MNESTCIYFVNIIIACCFCISNFPSISIWNNRDIVAFRIYISYSNLKSAGCLHVSICAFSPYQVQWPLGVPTTSNSYLQQPITFLPDGAAAAAAASLSASRRADKSDKLEVSLHLMNFLFSRCFLMILEWTKMFGLSLVFIHLGQFQFTIFFATDSGQ